MRRQAGWREVEVTVQEVCVSVEAGGIVSVPGFNHARRKMIEMNSAGSLVRGIL